MSEPFDLQDLSAFLTVLARADGARLKAEAEALLPALGTIEVVQSRSGLVMVPLRDTVQGTDFFLGEALVAEAHIRLHPASGEGAVVEGYGMVTGHDLEQAMAMALLDGAHRLGLPEPARFVCAEAALQQAEDVARLCAIEATRVDMETF